MQGEACFSVSYLVVTRSVVGCSNLVASIRCERGGDTQGEACFGVSYLAVTQSVLVVRCNLVASTRCERGGDTQKAKLASRLVIWAVTQSVERCNQVALHACDGSVVATCKAKLFSLRQG